MNDETCMEFFGDNPEPCLAGTLCLMSLYRDNPCPIIGHKIIHNLFVLAHQSAFTAPFRAILKELHGDWSKRLAADSIMNQLGSEKLTSH
jgi:hypothetical protein